jgi:hypothetical protein
MQKVSAPRRKFTQQVIHPGDMTNIICEALNTMKFEVDEKGKYIYKYHNFSNVAAWIDKNKGIKFTNSALPSNLKQNQLASSSKKLFHDLYRTKSLEYTKYSGNSFTFNFKNPNKIQLLLKATTNLLRFN